MKVLLVTNDWSPGMGGIQTYLEGLVTRTRHEVRVVAPAHPDARSDRRVVRHRSRRFLGASKATASWVAGEAERFGADLVWYGAPHPPALVAPAVAQRTGLPYAVHVHGAELVVADTLPGVRRRLRRSLRAATAVWSVSRHTADEVARRAGREATVLGVGVDAERFHPGDGDDPHGGFVVACVGRFVPRKGHHRVLRAVAMLRRDGVEASVLLVGWGRREGALRRLARRLDVPTRFEVSVGPERLGELYRECHAFAMPVEDRWFGLEREGLGIVYLEAAASGLPVVAGYSGGAPETVVPGLTGFLASRVGDLTGALSWLAADPARARAMGLAGRAFVVERYGWDAVTERFDGAVDEAGGVTH